MKEAAKPALIVYDGDCVFCQSYVRFMRLRETVGAVELVDARSGDPRVATFQRQGYDLNEGMLFVFDDRVYHGDEAVNLLAILSSSSSLFGWFNRAVLSNKTAARLIYPVLKFGRRVTLRMRGRPLLPTDLDRSPDASNGW
ncbi:DCC1-like thiol-disulfide oxidoreductase family protein [Sinorhizobium psoraleae]|uniref:DCC1-like thiol-disulfide oxidoreductase family protein n=1 Tax=Sinorhizobium psoraleae TaxID=520838 RepID=A0ABT4KB42_9HYPH|nr:DCC1-like thiol-disulfide oxidoreductase family protein [Sinorhizobium psoraleae]MCZ4089179.1 DCC1-like thiol-disulfide oxidoreductase family protein [Sinorhizobium psoraleae]